MKHSNNNKEMHRTPRNSIHEQPPPTKLRSSGSNNENSTSVYHERKLKKGIRKRIEVMLSKLHHDDSFRTKLRKVVHIFFIASIIMSAIIFVLNTIDLIPHTKRFVGKLPRNMVQLVGEDDYSRLQFLSQMKFNWGSLKDVHNHEYHYKHGHESFEEGNCKAMHQWQFDAYPTCNVLHEADMNKLRHVGRGGFRDGKDFVI